MDTQTRPANTFIMNSMSNEHIKKELQCWARRVEAYQHIMTGYSILTNLPETDRSYVTICQQRCNRYAGYEAEAAVMYRRFRELAAERGLL